MFSSFSMRGLGALLLLAAALKMYGLAIDPVGVVGIFSEPWLQTLIVEWEILLGVWLVWGVHASLAWGAGMVTFLIFGAFSFWQGSIGQTSCGCFGAIRVNPWLAFGIDVGILAGLVASRWWRSTGIAEQSPAGLMRNLVWGACGVSLALGCLAVTGTVVFGSPAGALAYLRGERLSAYPALVDIGIGDAGEAREVIIRLRNWTTDPIRVVGGTSDCSCVVTRDLPLTVQPDESSTLTVRLRFSGSPGQFTRIVRVFTDNPHSHTIGFRLTGRIRDG